MTLLPANELKAPVNKPQPNNPARWMHERIARSIINFEQRLAENEQVGARLVSFGDGGTIVIEDLGYWGPDLIVFFGKDSHGNRVELMQHYTQVNVLLLAIKAAEPKEVRRIGFSLQKRLEEDSDEDEVEAGE